MALYIFHRHRVCLTDRVDLICILYRWREGFGSSSLATLPLGFNSVLFPPLHVGHLMGLLLMLSWRTWVCPCEGQVWRWCSCLDCRGSDSTRYSWGGDSYSSRKYKALEGHDNQYWPIHSSILAWRTPSVTERPGRPVYRVEKNRTGQKRPCAHRQVLFYFIFFGLWQLCPSES